MIEGRDFICFCNDWHGDPLSKQQIITRLARANRVLWINSTGTRNPTISAYDAKRAWKKIRQFLQGCRKAAENISVFSPLVIPFHGSRLARRINRRLLAWSVRRECRKLGFKNPITLSFVPTSAGIAGSLGESAVIYYCVDEYSEFTGTDKAAMLDMERRLMERSDLVIVSASRLYETKHPYNANTFLITHGVDVEHFRKACLDATPLPEGCPMGSGPTIGFFGLIGDWVNLDVVAYLAAARPSWSFVLIGDVVTDASAVKSLPNVRLLGRLPYQSLPGYCKSFDVAILPFVLNELTLAANPLKLREYVAAGLPVVATPLPEVRKLERFVRLATTGSEYLNQIEQILSAGETGPRLYRSRWMDSHSWDAKVEELSRYIAGIGSVRANAAPAAGARQVA